MAKNTGGPAFPEKKRVYRAGYQTNDLEPVSGMQLRDYFAAKAMQGLLANLPGSLKGTDWRSNVARTSYLLADAMLDVRENW